MPYLLEHSQQLQNFCTFSGEDRSLTGAGTDRPDFLGWEVQFFAPRNVDTSLGGLNQYFNGVGGGGPTGAGNPFFRRVGSAQDATVVAGRFGSLGRNVFHGPGLNSWDFGVLKRTRVLEAQEVEFHAEFYNAFNHTQFNNPNGNIASPNFGAITTTRDPRILQFALKYKF